MTRRAAPDMLDGESWIASPNWAEQVHSDGTRCLRYTTNAISRPSDGDVFVVFAERSDGKPWTGEALRVRLYRRGTDVVLAEQRSAGSWNRRERVEFQPHELAEFTVDDWYGFDIEVRSSWSPLASRSPARRPRRKGRP